MKQEENHFFLKKKKVKKNYKILLSKVKIIFIKMIFLNSDNFKTNF